MFRRLTVIVLALASGVCFAANKEMQQLQRDVAQLQFLVTQLQRSQDEKLAALQTLVQQALNSANDANKSVAVIQSGLKDSIREQQEKVTSPVLGLGKSMDSMGADFRTLQTAMGDLTDVVNKMRTQLTDMNRQMQLMQTPAAAPPPPAGAAPGGDSASTAPSMPAEELLAAADRDRLGGKLDYALQEYAEYLKYYASSPLAPKAQLYVGMIYFGQKDYEKAVAAFDAVLEKYSADKKVTPQAYFYKGKSLLALGRKTDAGNEYKDLIRLFPNEDLSKQACTELQGLGLRCSVPKAAAPAKPASKAARTPRRR